MNDIAPASYDDRVRLARMAALEGYGWADLVVRYGLKEDVARLLVWSAAAKRQAQRDVP